MGQRITRAQAAEIAGVAPDTFSGYVSRGHAPGPVEHVGSTGLWDEDEVVQWQASRPGPGGWSASRARHRAASSAALTDDQAEICRTAASAAADAFSVSVDDVMGPGRVRAVADARIVAMAVAYCAGVGPQEVALAFRRGPSTVHHAVRRARETPELREVVAAVLETALAGRVQRDL